MVRRRDPAHLLILGTYRPVDVIVHAHPLRPLLAELPAAPRSAPSGGTDYSQSPARDSGVTTTTLVQSQRVKTDH